MWKKHFLSESKAAKLGVKIHGGKERNAHTKNVKFVPCEMPREEIFFCKKKN